MARRLRASHGLRERRRRKRPSRRAQLSRATTDGALPWRIGEPPAGGVEPGFLRRSVVEVARALLGCRLESTIDGVRTSCVIVETEAYGGPEDPASHAATVSGVTDRNRAMFGPAGRAYVYRSYGVHWCMNVVTGEAGRGEAVLLRGAAPLEGDAAMMARRGRGPLCSGPGRLCQALGITDRLYGHDLREPPLRLLGGWRVPEERVAVSGRVGVSAAADRPHRFYVRGAAGVSRRDGWRAST